MIRSASALLHILRALAQAFAILVIVFLLVRAIPGDAVDVLALEGDLDAAQAAARRAEFGLDRPLVVQFTDWVVNAAGGDLGRSLRFGRPVAEMIWNALPTTIGFAALSFAIGIVLAATLAIGAVIVGGRILPSLVDGLNLWSIAFPTFCVGVVAILVFSIWLGWTPVVGAFLLPAIVIGIDNGGQIVKTLHEELRESMSAAHLRTARAKGLSKTRIILRHLLPTALPTALSLSGIVLAGLIGGALTMEVLFGLPGIGSLLLNAIHGRDYPVVQAAIALIALGVVAINLVTDLLHGLIDPRMAR